MRHGCRKFLILIITIMILLSTGPVVPVMAADVPSGGTFIAEPSVLDFGILRGREIKSRSFLIETGTDHPLDWKIKGGMTSWLSLSAVSGTNGTSPLQIMATVDSMHLTPGRYSTELLCAVGNGHVKLPLFFTLLAWQHGEGNPALERIVVNPGEVSGQKGEKALLTARGIYSDGTERDMTESVAWVSGDSRIVDFPFKGVLAGGAVGDTYMFAQSGPVKSPVSIVRVDPDDGPVMRLSTNDIKVGRIEQGTKKEVSFLLRNGGKGTLEWFFLSAIPWIDFPDDLAGENRGETAASGEMPGGEAEPVTDDASLVKFPQAGSVLSEYGRREITLTVDTTGLPAGEYAGKLFLRSNGGDEMVRISMTVVTLEKIVISPTSVSLAAGEKRKFRATGIWSDRRRSDLSPASEGQWIVSDADAGAFHRRRPVFTARKSGFVEIRKVKDGISSNPAYVEISDSEPFPVLMVTPREVSLGKIGPGERSKSVLVMENVGTGILEWAAFLNGAPDMTDAILAGEIGKSPRYIRVMVDSLLDDNGEQPLIRKSYPVLVRIESGSSTYSGVRELPPGIEREEIHVTYRGGTRSLFFNYEISPVKTRPDLEVMPPGIDFGRMTQGKEVTKKVMVRNDGKNILTWNALLQKNRRTFRKTPLKKGRYLSLFKATEADLGTYQLPSHLRERVFLSGEWYERDGYPYSTGDGDAMRITFEGKGVTVFLWKDVDGGRLNAFIDGNSVGELDCGSLKRERVEFTVADDLEEGTHMLTIVGRKGVIELEGVRIEGVDIEKTGRNWLRLFPNRGTAANETDYVNVIVDTRDLVPGIYADNIIFYSNDESEIVEVSLEIKEGRTDYVAIYKYVNGTSCLLTPRQDAEKGGFKGEGSVFTLFPEGTPGTSPFFRWYNQSTGDYYYSYEQNGNDIDHEEYLFEGAIGNIATVRLPDTRELFRWYNLDTGMHFYTTDTKGEGYEKNGYRYDGIAGYVK